MGKITLTIHKPKETASEIIRITPEAAEAINRLIVQAAQEVQVMEA